MKRYAFLLLLLASACGSSGGTGPAGAVGPTGASGPAGAVGPTGPAGPAGVAGPAGAVGPTGPAGSYGPQGATGAAGPAGATGAMGPAGPAGPTGPAGPAGSGSSPAILGWGFGVTPITITDSGLTIVSKAIDVPGPGYVVATCTSSFTLNDTTDLVRMTVCPPASPTCISATGVDATYQLNAAVAADAQATLTTSLFPESVPSAGTYTFYCNALRGMSSGGTITATSYEIHLVYYPGASQQ